MSLLQGCHSTAITSHLYQISLSPSRGVVKYLNASYQSSIDDLTQSIQLAPSHVYLPLYNRAQAYHALGHFEKASLSLMLYCSVAFCSQSFIDLQVLTLQILLTSQQLGSEVERQGNGKSTTPRKALYFQRKEEELPWVGFEPTTLYSLSERSTH